MGNYFNYDDELPDFSLGGINSSLDSLFEPATAKPQDWEQAFGKPTFGNQRLKLEGEEAKARDSAFGYLSKVVNRNDDISPSQGIAAALLAAIPTLGGYMMGRNAPKIPDNVFFRNSADLEAFTDPSATALQQGAALGNKVGTGYLNDIEKVAAENRLVNKDLGEMEEKRAERLATKADQFALEELQANERRDLQEDSQRFQSEHLRAEEASKIRVANAKPTADKDLEAEVSDPVKREAFARISAGQGTVADFQLLSPSASAKAAANMRSVTYAKSVENSDDRARERSVIPGYVDKSGRLRTPGEAAEIDETNRGVAKTVNLINEFIARPNEFTGDESAIQGAISGLLMNAQRQATGSGANFTQTEQDLIARALPYSKAGNLMGFLKQEALGRDQQTLAKTLTSLYRKTRDYELAESGLFREDPELPTNYYPEKLTTRYGYVPKVQSSFGGDQPDAGGGSKIPQRLPGESIADYSKRTGL